MSAQHSDRRGRSMTRDPYRPLSRPRHGWTRRKWSDALDGLILAAWALGFMAWGALIYGICSALSELIAL